MQDPENAKLLLNMARKDHKAIKQMLDDNAFDTEIFGFHAQQAMEKALKAWLSIIGIIYPKTHDLDELFSLLKENNIKIPADFINLDFLTEFAVQFRYEAYACFEENLDRKSIISTISDLINHIENQF